MGLYIGSCIVTAVLLTYLTKFDKEYKKVIERDYTREVVYTTFKDYLADFWYDLKDIFIFLCLVFIPIVNWFVILMITIAYIRKEEIIASFDRDSLNK